MKIKKYEFALFGTLFISLLLVGLYTFSLLDKLYTQHNKFGEILTSLQLRNNEISNLSSQRFKLINFDHIVKSVNDFESGLTLLENSLVKSESSNEIIENIEKLKKEFYRITDVVEDFKSYNSSIINSIYYLYDLRDRIVRENNSSLVVEKLIGNTLFMMMQSSMKLKIDAKIYKEIEKLERENLKNHHELISTFIDNSRDVLEFSIQFEYSIKSLENNQISKILSNLLRLFDRRCNSIHKNIKAIIYALLTIIFFISIFVYIRNRDRTKSSLQCDGLKHLIGDEYDELSILNSKGEVIYSNRDDISIGTFVRELNPKIYGKDALKLEEIVEHGGDWSGEILSKDRDELMKYEKIDVKSIIKDGDRNPTGFIIIKRDITKDRFKKRENS